MPTDERGDGHDNVGECVNSNILVLSSLVIILLKLMSYNAQNIEYYITVCTVLSLLISYNCICFYLFRPTIVQALDLIV